MARVKKSQDAKELNDASAEANINSNEIGELKKMIEFLSKKIESMQKKEIEDNNNDLSLDKGDDDSDFDNIKINQDDYIKVVSLTPFTLNLSTRPGGKGGKIFSFNGFGQTKRILYGDLVEILENFSHFLENGYFYIADSRVIRKNGLHDIYSKILSKDKIEAILSGNNNDSIVSLFKSCNSKQQELIIQMLIDKRLLGEDSVDLNLWDKLNRCTSIDMDEKYQTTKQYIDSMNNDLKNKQ